MSYLLFLESEHIFDEESEVLKILQRNPTVINNQLVSNFKFGESINDRRIQICDVLVKCLSQFFNYLKNVNPRELEMILRSLKDTQKKNLILVCKIINKSYRKNSAFTFSINSLSEQENLNRVMKIYNKTNLKS